MAHREGVDPVLRELFQPELRKSDLKRLKIIEKAIHCLVTFGEVQTTLDLIGKKMKISRSHVVYYFKDQDSLFEAIVKYITASAQKMTVERVQTATTPVEQLVAIIDAAFLWADKYSDHAKAMLIFYHKCTYDPRYRELNSMIRQSGRERLALILEGVARKNRGDLTIDFADLAQSLQCLISGHLMDRFCSNSQKSLSDLSKSVQRSVQSSLQLADKWV